MELVLSTFTGTLGIHLRPPGSQACLCDEANLLSLELCWSLQHLTLMGLTSVSCREREGKAQVKSHEVLWGVGQ